MRLFVVLATLCLAASPCVARAQRDDGPRVPDAVSVAFEGCEGMDALVVIDAVRVELASDGIRDVHAVVDDESAIANVRITCAAGASFVLRVDDRITHKSVERTVTLEGVARTATARALALSIAELLHASWAELDLEDPEAAPPTVVDALRVRVRSLREARALSAPTPEPRAAPRDEPQPAPAPPPAPRTEIAAEGIVRAFPGGGAAPLGGRLTLELPLGASVRASVDGEAALGTAIHPEGAIDLGYATGALSLGYDVILEVLQLSLAARVAVGGAWTSGHPTASGVTGASGGGVLVLVGAMLGLRVPVGEWITLRLDVEGGGVPVGFEAYVDRTPVAGLLGGYVSVGAGIGLRL